MQQLRALLKPWVHSIIFPAIEAAWAALFRFTGILLHPNVREWSSPRGQSVLVIAPHPDDETLGCGGVISLHHRAGDKVYVLIVTDGGSSGAGSLGREEIVRRRGHEAANALAALGEGVNLIQLALPEGLWRQDELVERLKGVLIELKPKVIYTTSCVDFHPEHLRVASALADALNATRERNGCQAVRAYEVQVPLTPLLTNMIADIGDVVHLKRRALQAYATQLPALPWQRRHARYLRALYRCRGTVEAFWEMPPELFGKVMRHEQKRPGRVSLYRSLRLRPFADGLAWLVGSRARWRLRHANHYNRSTTMPLR